LGRGLGWGFRGGRGWGGSGWAAYAPPFYPYAAPAAPYPAAAPKPGQEADMLKGQVEYLEETLEGIKKRIAELESAGSEA
jgi:hypothetical protein